MLQLPNQLNAKYAETLYQEILRNVLKNDHIYIDISAVIQVDTVALQVLCALQAQCAYEGKVITWLGSSEAFSNTVYTLGLTDYLPITN